MLPYQERVVAEKTALDDKVADLSAFIEHCDSFIHLDSHEQNRLERQLVIMMEYSKILEERIAAF
jgi:hypothetical protein